MSNIEKEVTKYMITTDPASVEALEAARNLVESNNGIRFQKDKN